MPLSRIITQTDWFPDLTQLTLHICVHLQITLQTMVDMEGDLFFFRHFYFNQSDLHYLAKQIGQFDLEFWD